MSRENRVYDTLLELHDGASAITADGAGQVDAAAKIWDTMDGGSVGDTGLGIPFVKGDAIVDVTAFDFTTGDEVVNAYIEGSPDSDFGTAGNIEVLAVVPMGNAMGGLGSTSTKDRDGTGRYVVPFTNEINGTRYRYVRVYFDVSGTTPSYTGIVRVGVSRDGGGY